MRPDRADSQVTDRRLVPHAASSNAHGVIQLRFEPQNTLIRRKRPRDDADEEEEEDFAVLGAVIKTKYARVEDPDDRERSSTPLMEVQPCDSCGCRCGGKGKDDEESSGPARRGGWSTSLSNRVKGNILGTPSPLRPHGRWSES